MMVFRMVLEMMGLILMFGIIIGLGCTAYNMISDWRFRRRRRK